MKKNSGPFHTGARSSTKDKQRKTNRIYNISITVVIVLILIVGGSILFSKDETKQASTTPAKEASTQPTDKGDTGTSKAEDKDSSSANDDSNTEENGEKNADSGIEETGQDDSTVNLESEDENDVNTNTSDSADSVGTTQSSNAEVTNFDKGSNNWTEMENAVAQGAGISTDNMTVLWLGNGGAPGKAVGTVSAKDTKQVYSVNIEWVEGSGWKPVKVEKK
ncbi:YrrS family protein [Peribacillus loiseleuriae]|uniref:DUF1510 domain-containing protein n=1 Tax=Peribacillus loiseleuriae TaxID=1679170 RepID=A0A0K9GW76_9BACI|nr:YrrS family protein [Peribacillus loiseleuriae]KMY50888.1 hypothetical protein AC625_16285 [Peribacillus loiseleuriae]